MCVGLGPAVAAALTVFIIFFQCFQRNKQSRDERGRGSGRQRGCARLGEYVNVLDMHQCWANWGGTLAQRLMITGFCLQNGRWPNREHLRPVLMLSAKRVVNSRLVQENARVQREVEDVFLVLQEQIKFIIIRRQERERQGNVRKTASALNKLSSS